MKYDIYQSDLTFKDANGEITKVSVGEILLSGHPIDPDTGDELILVNNQLEVPERKNLSDIPTSDLVRCLREDRNTAFILWTTEDIILKAKNDYPEYSAVTQEEAEDIIQDLNRTRNCEFGITWDTIEDSIFSLKANE